MIPTFIKIHGSIIQLDSVLRVWAETRNDEVITKLTLRNSHKFESTQAWSGNIVDEIWEIIKVAKEPKDVCQPPDNGCQS